LEENDNEMNMTDKSDLEDEDKVLYNIVGKSEI